MATCNCKRKGGPVRKWLVLSGVVLAGVGLRALLRVVKHPSEV